MLVINCNALIFTYYNFYDMNEFTSLYRMMKTMYRSGGGAGTKILERMSTKRFSRKNTDTTTPSDFSVF